MRSLSRLLRVLKLLQCHSSRLEQACSTIWGRGGDHLTKIYRAHRFLCTMTTKSLCRLSTLWPWSLIFRSTTVLGETIRWMFTKLTLLKYLTVKLTNFRKFTIAVQLELMMNFQYNLTTSSFPARFPTSKKTMKKNASLLGWIRNSTWRTS